MDDMVAYRIGDLKVVIRNDPSFIGCVTENLDLMQCPYVTADYSQVNDMADLFRGLP